MISPRNWLLEVFKWSEKFLQPVWNQKATEIQVPLYAPVYTFHNPSHALLGRDIFHIISGLLLIPGRFDVARAHLLAFAGCVYRGLIPNLLDSARRPRYNARDATWWFMQALQDYCKYSPEGYAILNQDVPLRFLDRRRIH